MRMTSSRDWPDQLSDRPSGRANVIPLTLLNGYSARLHFRERSRHLIMATNPMPTYSPDDLFDLALPPGVIGFELVDGVPVEVTPVGYVHGVIAGEIYGRIRDHLKQ